MRNRLKAEIDAFLARKAGEQGEARIRVAAWKALREDPERFASEDPARLAAHGQRLLRQIRRERIRGLCRPWEYDLEYHMALKRALEALRTAGGR